MNADKANAERPPDNRAGATDCSGHGCGRFRPVSGVERTVSGHQRAGEARHAQRAALGHEHAVASITDQQNQLSLTQAQAALTQAQAQLATDTANLLKNNQTAVTNAQNALASLKLQLSTSSNSTANQLASARLGLQSAELSYTSKTAPAAASTIASDQASVTSAQESVRQAQIQVNGATLTAPADGTVAAVSVVAGLLAPSGNAITLEVGPMQVTASFAESAIGSIKVGQPTAVTVAAVGQTLDGTVSQITPTAATAAGGSSVVTYAVQITLTNAPATVLSGMSASVAVTTAQART